MNRKWTATRKTVANEMRKANVFFFFSLSYHDYYTFLLVFFFFRLRISFGSAIHSKLLGSQIIFFCAQFQFPCAIVHFEIYSELLYRLRFLVIVWVLSSLSTSSLFLRENRAKNGIFNLQQSALLLGLCGICYCEREHSQLNAVHFQASELFSFWCMVSFLLLILGQVWNFHKDFQIFSGGMKAFWARFNCLCQFICLWNVASFSLTNKTVAPSAKQIFK